MYVAGLFTTAGGLPASNVAMWNETTDQWIALGAGLNGEVDDLLYVGPGELYAGGQFTMSGLTNISNIARWNGATWAPLGSGIVSVTPGRVTSLAEGSLFVGGDFDEAGGKASSGIAMFDNSLLPVELVEFRAMFDAGALMLSWETASETGFTGFEIEHQDEYEATSWSSIGFVESTGSIKSGSAYTYRINEINPGLHRFRLAQIDEDGSARYSPVVEVAVPLSCDYFVEPAYPNPFRESAVVHLAISEQQQVRAVLYDIFGRAVSEVFNENVLADRMTTIRLDGNNLASGSYILRVEGRTFATDERVVIVR